MWFFLQPLLIRGKEGELSALCLAMPSAQLIVKSVSKSHNV